MYETILISDTDGVAALTINRPAKLNALSVGLQQELMAKRPAAYRAR